MYSVKEIYYTLQGEGAQSGRAAIFCRFAGCNLWSGREQDREKAICQFCDTDFVGTNGPGGGSFQTAQDLAQACYQLWPDNVRISPFIVLTGGEPMLQVNQALIDALHALDFEIAIETNGTQTVPRDIDWICVSPKANAPFVQKSGDELKLVYPQTSLHPQDVANLDFRYFFLQPMDGARIDENLKQTLAYCRANPQWRLSLQAHKILQIP